MKSKLQYLKSVALAGITAVVASGVLSAQAFNDPVPATCPLNVQVLTVVAPVTLPGNLVTITVTGATPGTLVDLVISNSLPQTPPIPVGTFGCLLVNPAPTVGPSGVQTLLIATLVADATGTAMWSFFIPGINDPFQDLILFQSCQLPMGDTLPRLSNLSGFIVQF